MPGEARNPYIQTSLKRKKQQRQINNQTTTSAAEPNFSRCHRSCHGSTLYTIVTGKCRPSIMVHIPFTRECRKVTCGNVLPGWILPLANEEEWNGFSGSVDSFGMWWVTCCFLHKEKIEQEMSSPFSKKMWDDLDKRCSRLEWDHGETKEMFESVVRGNPREVGIGRKKNQPRTSELIWSAN